MSKHKTFIALALFGSLYLLVKSKKTYLEHLVLLIDDDPDEHILISEAFKRISKNIRIVAFETGESALQQMSCDDTDTMKADFILLDINMPRMDGFSVLKHLKGDTKTNTGIRVFHQREPRRQAKVKKTGSCGVLQQTRLYEWLHTNDRICFEPAPSCRPSRLRILF